MYDGEVVGVDLPAAVELTVTETEPGVQGDRVSGARKPATLETGLVVQVPLFVEPGEKIKVDTRTGEYLARPERRRIEMAVTGSRREARERALGLCYELEVRDLGRRRCSIEQQPAPPDEYAVQLVRGVEEHSAELDDLLRKFSEHWALERMPAVDRAVLRLGCLRARLGARRADRGRHQRGGRAGQAVLHQGLRPVRQRLARAGSPSSSGTSA